MKTRKRYAWPDAQGNFIYTPQSLAYGPVSVTANLVQWDTTQKTYVERDSKQVSFNYDQEADTAPVLVSSAPVDGNGQPITVASGNSYPLTSDPVIGGQLSFQGKLQGLTVQFDTTGGTTPNASITTDQYGRYSFAPVGLAYGTVTINMRTQVLDPNTHQLLTSSWTPITFTYQQPPAATPTIGSFQLATSSTDSSGNVTAGDPTVSGSVTEDGLPSPSSQSGDGPAAPSPNIADLTVQIQVNGTVVGSTLTDSQGNFSYTPSGLAVGSSVTIEARAVSTDAAGNAVDGAWSAPITFTLVSNDTSTSVSKLQLVDGSGNPVTSLLTSNPMVSGQITASGSLSGVPSSGITVELDTNGDGQPDETTTTDANGQFTFSLSGLPEGVVAVSARTSTTSADGTTTTSAWTSLKFVYTTDPGDPQMQGLAAALVAQANSAGTSETDYESSQTAAASSLQESLAGSQSGQSSGDAAATATYNSSASAADSTFASQASTAESNFATALQSYPGDTTSYTVNDLAWPSPPPPAQLPDDPEPEPPAEQPAQPGPTFDVTQDPGYQSAVAVAQTIHDQAVQGATGNYQTEVAQANGIYDASLMAAASLEEQTLTALATVTGTNPYDVAAATIAYNDTISSLDDDAYNQGNALDDAYQSKVDAALTAENAAFESAATTYFAAQVALAAEGIKWHIYGISQTGDAWDDPSVYLGWILTFYSPIFSHYADWLIGHEEADNNWTTSDAAAAEQFQEAEAKAEALREEGQSNVQYQENTGAATALFTLSETAAEAAYWDATSSANVAYSNALLTDQAREAFAVAQAKAQQQLEDSLAKAARNRTYANADAESTLTQSIATAAASATATWAAEEGTPWAQYQASLAEDQAQYVGDDAPQHDQLLHSEADADYAKAQGIDKAGEQQAEAAAGAAQTLADATAKAAKDRALG